MKSAIIILVSLVLTSPIIAQNIPSIKVVSIDNLSNYLKPEVKKEIVKEGIITSSELAQYFRDAYNNALKEYPLINSPINITKVEVWVTNRTSQTDNVRNVVAFQDLGESDVIGSAVSVNVGPNALPDNENNNYDPTNIKAFQNAT